MNKTTASKGSAVKTATKKLSDKEKLALQKQSKNMEKSIQKKEKKKDKLDKKIKKIEYQRKINQMNMDTMYKIQTRNQHLKELNKVQKSKQTKTGTSTE